MRSFFIVWFVLNSAYAFFLIGSGEVRDPASITLFMFAIVGEMIVMVFGLETRRSSMRLARYLLLSFALGVYTVLSAMPEDREIAQIILFLSAVLPYTNVVIVCVEWLFGPEEEMPI